MAQNAITSPKIEALAKEQMSILEQAGSLLERAIAEKRSLTDSEIEQEKSLRERNNKIKNELGMLERLAEIEAQKGSEYMSRRASEGDLSKIGSIETMGFKSAGDFFDAVRRSHKRASGIDSRLIAMAEVEKRTGMVSSDPDGGFLVPAEVSKEVLKRQYDFSDIISRVREIPTNSNLLRVPSLQQKSESGAYIFGGIQAYWVQEGFTGTQTSPKFDVIDIQVRKLMALVPMTNELLEDASSLSEWLQSTVPEALAYSLEGAILAGTGTADLTGIFNSPAVVTKAKESGQEADTIEYDNLLSMLTSFTLNSRRRGLWVANQDTIKTLGSAGQIVGSAGTPLFQNANYSAQNAVLGPILGMPVVFSPFMKTVGDLNDIILIDPMSYILATRGGVRAEASMHVLFDSDSTMFRFVRRIGGAPGIKNSMAALNGTNTISPFVNLAERA